MRRVEVSLLLTNNTSDLHSFQLPDPRFRWWLRLNSAEVHSADQEIELAAIDVAPHSVQLLTAIVAATAADAVPAAISNAACPSSAPAAVTADQ
jgi:hypothetical protein